MQKSAADETSVTGFREQLWAEEKSANALKYK